MQPEMFGPKRWAELLNAHTCYVFALEEDGIKYELGSRWDPVENEHLEEIRRLREKAVREGLNPPSSEFLNAVVRAQLYQQGAIDRPPWE